MIITVYFRHVVCPALSQPRIVSIIHCRLAFERALELDPQCVGALVGLAVLELNSQQVTCTSVDQLVYVTVCSLYSVCGV